MPRMTVREALVAIRELIGDEARWTQGEYARNQFGRRVDPRDETACRWCFDGAAKRVTAGDAALFLMITRAFEHRSRRLSHEINDSSTHAEVMARIDAAIARCKESENGPV